MRQEFQLLLPRFELPEGDQGNINTEEIEERIAYTMAKMDGKVEGFKVVQLIADGIFDLLIEKGIVTEDEDHE